MPTYQEVTKNKLEVSVRLMELLANDCRRNMSKKEIIQEFEK